MPLTTLYDPSINVDIEAFNFLDYQQLPTAPVYVVPSATAASGFAIVSGVPNLLSNAVQNASGTKLDTEGTGFNNLTQADIATLSPFVLEIEPPTQTTADDKTGYAGFTNYTAKGLEGIDLASIQNNTVDVNSILNAPTFETTTANFPVLDPTLGFTLSFDLAISEEDSNTNRAGFSLVLVTNDPTKEIELGFTKRGGDRVFAQSTNFTEAEDTAGTTLDFSTQKTYSLAVQDSKYVLSVDGTNILSGDLRDYNFNPATSNPPLPASPYDLKNLLFLGDNTDQAHAEFTLGDISITTPDVVSVSFNYPFVFSFTQVTQIVSQTIVINQPVASPTFEINSIPLGGFFDEYYYLQQYSDVAAAVKRGEFATGYDHFVTFGLDEGRIPSVFYNESFYLAQHSDVRSAVQAGIFKSGLEHFLLYGHIENRSPSTEFDSQDYLLNNPDVFAAIKAGGFKSAFEHFVKAGAAEGRLSGKKAFFQEGYYLSIYTDVKAAVDAGIFESGLDHFNHFGIKEGRSPNSEWDEGAYLAANADVAAAVKSGILGSGIEHFTLYGYLEARALA
ncbi:MAG: hypothetical protein ACFBSG_12310 [Leptolyngbyaceae cyanobacterium]